MKDWSCKMDDLRCQRTETIRRTRRQRDAER